MGATKSIDAIKSIDTTKASSATKSVFTEEYAVFLSQMRAMRQAAGLNQRELAERLGRSVLYVSRCERGERRVDVIELRALCAAIGVPVGEFVRQLDTTLQQSGNQQAGKTEG